MELHHVRKSGKQRTYDVQMREFSQEWQAQDLRRKYKTAKQKRQQDAGATRSDAQYYLFSLIHLK
jgi:hypothetical protein